MHSILEPPITRGFHKVNPLYWTMIFQKPNCKQVSPFVHISKRDGTVTPVCYLYRLLYLTEPNDTIVHSVYGYRRFNIDTYRYTGADIKAAWKEHKTKPQP